MKTGIVENFPAITIIVSFIYQLFPERVPYVALVKIFLSNLFETVDSRSVFVVVDADVQRSLPQ